MIKQNELFLSHEKRTSPTVSGFGVWTTKNHYGLFITFCPIIFGQVLIDDVQQKVIIVCYCHNACFSKKKKLKRKKVSII